MAEYNLQWCEIMQHRSKFVVYGVGQHVDHIMDWRGCNFHHGRARMQDGAVDSPRFDSPQQAEAWVKKNWADLDGVQRGHHSGADNECTKGCHNREVGIVVHEPRVQA